MRIGLDYRFVSFGSSVTRRGMGRFSQQQLREVLATDERHEYVLLCREGFDPAEILPEIRSDPKVRIRCLPRLAPVEDGETPNGGRRALVLEAELQEAVAAERLDVFHATTPFLLGDVVPQRIAACPYVATHYDLIPMVYPDEYFPGEQDRLGRQAYERALSFVSRADRLAAISRFVRDEAAVYLGFPGERIDVAYPFAEPIFAQVGEAEAEAAITGLRARLGLEGDFVVSVTHLHFSKNLGGLLRSFAELQRRGRFADVGLVVVCGLEPGQGRYVRDLAWQHGVRDHLYLTDLILDSELAALFNRCRAAVLVSRYEGFGLPALEALQCGAPVVAGSAASLPEIVGSAALLVDPASPDEVADALERVLCSESLREELGGRGLERSRSFDARRLADATLESYQRAAEPRQQRRRRISVWSPVPPQESGVADYTIDLVEWLEQHADVEVVIDQGVAPALERPLRATTFRVATRDGASWSSPDRVVFQFGGSHFHLFQFAHLDVRPDVVVLHDLTWGRVRWFAAHGDLAALEQEIAGVEGPRAASDFRRLVESTPPERLGEAAEEFFLRCFLLRPLVSTSSRQVVHFLGGAEALRDRYREANACYVPMGVADPLAAVPFEQRSHHTLPDAAGLEVGIFGIVDPVKRLERVADSVVVLAGSGIDVQVSVVGPFVNNDYRDELARYLAARGVADRFRFFGRVSGEHFRSRLLACDVVVNLRWPFRFQMSATLLQAVAAGKPVVVTDVPGWRMLPETFCRFLPPGEHEVADLAGELATLARDREELRRRGGAARSYFRERATLEVMGRSYLDLLDIESHAVPPEPARPLRACGMLQADHASNPEIAWALERLVPDPVERAERLRCAGGLGGSLAEAAACFALLRRFGALAEGRRVVVFGEPARPLAEAIEETAARVVAVHGGGEDGHLAATGAASEPRDLPPWRSGCDDASADGVVVARRLAIDSPADLAATVREALRVVRPAGVVIVCFSYQLAGPRDAPGGRWSGSLGEDDVAEWLVRASGGAAVEPFDGLPSPATLTAPRALTLVGPSGPERPVRIVCGRALCAGLLTLRRPAQPTPPESPESLDELSSEWGRRRDSGRGFTGLPPRQTMDSIAIERERKVSAPPEPPAADDHSDLRRFLGRWDELRARSSIEHAPAKNLLVRAGSFVLRSARRLRDLGIAWDRLRDVLVALVDRHLVVRRDLIGLQEEAASNRRVLAELVERVDALASRTEALSPADPPAAIPAESPRVDEPPAAIPRPSEVHALLREIGDLDESLGTAAAIEVSFAGMRAERLLDVALRLFGSRMASVASESYRSPNDFWIHVDLREDWPSEALLQNARSRLGPGGRLVLVTEAQGPAPACAGLVHLGTVSSRAVAGVRLARWRARVFLG
jgi:glycosyltransferase involved in cell wall biosynthesis/SAM-dependent methyltransferase